MRTVLVTAGVLGAVLAAGAASAQELEIENAAAQVVVIPEARSDVQVSVVQGRSGLPPIEVRRRRDGSVELDGDLRRRISNCEGGRGAASVEVRGVGRIPVRNLPVVTARVPLDAVVSAGGAVWGDIGRSRNLRLSSAGCGDWRAANVGERVNVSSAGSGDVHVGSSRQAEVSSAGSGDVRLGSVAGGLEASLAGSGDVVVASLGGGLQASSAGSGDIIVQGGRAGAVQANLAGSGDVRLPAAQSVTASIVGSGDVRVGQVAGQVSRRVMGSGDVIVGR